MADRGKRPSTPDEDTRPNKKKPRYPETFDPSYHGPPPASLQFSSEDSGSALLPLPATVTRSDVQLITNTAKEIDSNLSRRSASQRARRQREREAPQNPPSTRTIGFATLIPTLQTPSPIANTISQCPIQVPREILNKRTIAQRSRRDREKKLALSSKKPPSKASLAQYKRQERLRNALTQPSVLSSSIQTTSQSQSPVSNTFFSSLTSQIAFRTSSPISSTPLTPRVERLSSVSPLNPIRLFASQSTGQPRSMQPPIATMTNIESSSNSPQSITQPCGVQSSQVITMNIAPSVCQPSFTASPNMPPSMVQQGPMQSSPISMFNIDSSSNPLPSVDIASYPNNASCSNTQSRTYRQNEDIVFHDNVVDDEEYRWIPTINYAMLAQGRHFLGKLRETHCPHCKAWHWKDERLSKSSQSSPLFGMCCKQGTVNLPPLMLLPPALQELYDGDDVRSRSFRKHMREYNSAFAFTSLGFKLDDRVIHGQGPQCFTIQGELRHRTGSLLPDPGREAKYSQLYIYDPSVALNVRQGRNPDLREDVLRTIQDVMLQYNRFSKDFKHAHEVLSAEATRTGDDVNIRAHLHYSSKTDKRRYNLPTADEVAVILPGDGTEVDSIRDIVLHLRASGGLLQISECHPAYLPLHYVLLFPYGELGWSPELRRWDPLSNMATDKRMTQMKFFAYLLFERQGEYSAILRAKKLYAELLCDGWAATDQNKLRWVRLHQSQIRAELYNGLTDVSAECASPDQLGKRIILPSSHTGSPRHMFEVFQDSMAITRYNRHPDIFLTMTANPRWPEIVDALLPGQDPTDRPDLIARVFELKRAALMKYIQTSRLFGVVVAYVYTIEFQKRGLPHMHLLLYLIQPDKIHSVAQVDRVVCAEFPDPDSEPELFATVITCMVHGPCGTRNRHAACMENENCTKHYPRAFADTTTLGEDGYPIYRRRDTGQTYFVKNKPVNNKDVVPYNPVLSKMFNCHINVEVCAGIRCVKYIHKYIFKGHDRTTYVLNGLDELLQYLDARYIGAIEAAWRLLEFLMHAEFPNVVRLEVHLEGFHKVLFDPREQIEDIISRGKLQKSTLTAYFDCCALDPYAKQFTYQEFPQHYRWDGPNRAWIRRKRGFAIGRMYFVSPKDGDKFYLRLLLTAVKGPTSFKTLRTVGNDVCDTFKEACIRLGLIEDDSEWAQCLREAAIMQTGYQLRRLFCVILLECNPVYPHQLWNEFSEHICDDLAHKLRTMYNIPNPTEEQVKDYGLHLLNIMLVETSGKSLRDFPPMPEPVGEWSEDTGNRLIWEQQQFQFTGENARMHANAVHLNHEQREAYDVVIDSVTRCDGKLFFLNGPAGTGKTFVYNTIAATCRSQGDIVIMVASSGIASLLLAGGRTSHSTFKIPFDVLEDSICGFSKQSPHAELFRRTKLIIWDEVPMQHKYCVEAVDRSLRDACNNNRLFGGITVVFGGDFRQCLPVIPKGFREQIVGASLRRSYLWRDITVLTLVQNMRLENGDSENIAFANTLIEIGTSPDDIVQLPSTMKGCTSVEELLDASYPGLSHPSMATSEYLTERTILSARNDDVNTINLAALNAFPGEAMTYLGADSMAEVDVCDPTNINQVPSEYLNSLEPSGLPPFALKLKVGCPIMALRNIAPKDGVCNGTRMKVVGVSDHVINAVVLTGDKAGEPVFIPRISLTPSSSEIPVPFTRRQFPVRLAFAMTINKSQGQSVKYVGIDLQKDVFSHGQLYVALSRCTSTRRISVLLPPNAENRTTNIVYPEVLL